MNKKGAVPILFIVGGIVLLLFFLSGTLVAFKLSSIPAFVWVGLGILLIFLITGGKQK